MKIAKNRKGEGQTWAGVLLLGALGAFLLASALGAEEKQPVPPTLEGLIFDVSRFVGSLPANTLVYVRAGDSSKMTQGAIKNLGPTPGVRFFGLPPDAEPPVAKDQPGPHYPDGAPDKAEVRILALIGTKGTITAIYCYQSTDKACAISAADAVAHWQFSPAKLKGTAVPVLFSQIIEFNR